MTGAAPPAFVPGEAWGPIEASLRDLFAGPGKPLLEREDGSDAAARAWIGALARVGLLRWTVPAAHGGARPDVERWALCAIRQALAYESGLADVMFVMQGLGSLPIALAGTDECRRRWLPHVASGDAIAAFALTESEAGSDVSALQCRAVRDGSGYRITGGKTLISNAGVADFYTVFARTGDGEKEISAFVVPAGAPGLSVSARHEPMAPHPLGSLAFQDVPVTAGFRLGAEGDGFRLALETLNVFRATVGAAAVGFSGRALDEAVRHAMSRRQFGKRLADLPAIQAKLADMATELDASRLLVFRAAQDRSPGASPALGRVWASMAKLYATEAAARIVDEAVQIHGGVGVLRGSVVERLYREVRALRIYEGTSEIQRLVIGQGLIRLAAGSAEGGPNGG